MTRSRAVGGGQPPTARRGALWLVLPMVGLALVAVLGVVIWVSPHRAPTPESSGSAALGGAPGGSGGSVRTSSAKGSHAGYDATVESTRTEIGSATLTTLDVFLSTEGEPASAPTASAVLTGRDAKKHVVALSIVGSGHWISGQLRIAPGRYHVTARFNRQGKPVIIPMTISLV